MVAALLLVALMFAAALTVATAQEVTVARLQAHAPTVKRWGGVVLVLVGTWFIALAVFADFFAEVFAV